MAPLSPAESLGFVYEAAVASGLVANLEAAGPLASVGPWDPRASDHARDIARVGETLAARSASWESQCAAVVRCGHLHGQTIALRWRKARGPFADVRVLVPGSTLRQPAGDPTPDELAAALGVPREALPRTTNRTGDIGKTDIAVVARTASDVALLVVECGLGLMSSSEDGVPLLTEHENWRNLINRASIQRLGVGGFATPNATVDGPVGISFPRELRQLYRAIVRKTAVKKLFQGCAYAAGLGDVLATGNGRRVQVSVVATSMLGYEHLSAEHGPPGERNSASWDVLTSCGKLYPGYRETSDSEDAEAERLFDVRAHLRAHVGGAAAGISPPEAPLVGRNLDVRCEEEVVGFVRTHGHLPDGRPFRDAHASEVQKALCAAPPGAVTVVALTGAPGVGKTTAIREALQGRRGANAAPASVAGGWFYLYSSPRIGINSEQFTSLAKPADGRPTCCLTATYAVANRKRRARGFAYVRGWDHPLVLNTSAQTTLLQGKAMLYTHDCAQELEPDADSAVRHRVVRLSSERMAKTKVGRPAVLQGLAAAGREVVQAAPQVDRLAVAASLQALARQPEALNALLSSSEEPDQASALRFARRFPTIVVMLDEITGDEGAPEVVRKIRNWLEKTFVEGLKGTGVSPRVVLFISDASLTTAASVSAHLAHPNAPPRVLVSHVADDGVVGVQSAPAVLRLGGGVRDQQPCVLIQGNAYPAERLTIGYRLLLGATAAEDGLLNLRRSLNKRRGELLDDVIPAVTQEQLQQASHQVLCFVQNKRQLEAVAADLVESDTLRADQLLCVSANMSPDERDILGDEDRRDALRLVLMTSSGTRGISFPRAERLVAFLQPFTTEQHVMELVQFAWRGRGGKDGDRRNRHIEVVVLDAMADDDDELARARRHVDMLAAALTARASLHTRIFGSVRRADGAHVAVVPLGRSGIREDSEQLQHVLNDLRVAGARKQKDPRVARLLTACGDLLSRVDYRLPTGTLPAFPLNPGASWTRCVPELTLDSGVTACGPMLIAVRDGIEDVVSLSARERDELQAALRGFLGGSSRSYPHELVRAAKALNPLLDRAQEADGQQDLVGTRFRAQLVIPIAYEQIGSSLLSEPEGALSVHEHQEWGDTLRSWATLMTDSINLDVGAQTTRYEQYPFLIVADDIDPSGLADLGRREIARAGLLCNTLAGIVMGGDNGPPPIALR